MLKYLAPAKINLVLEVLGKRGDGYHEIRSLVQTVGLCDVISFELADVISLECSEPSLQTSDNLAVQAAELLREVSSCQKGVKIKLEKRIPWDAGLGGGSSDAATTLLALNKLWNLKLKTADLVELAARLGSDVRFFIHGGTALIEGRGEKVTPLTVSAPGWFVLLIPPLPKIPNKTQRLYSRLDARHFTGGQFVDRAVKSWSKDEQIASSLLFNVFDRVAFDAFPGLKTYREQFAEAGAKDIHLAGSGPALFAPVDSESGAKEIQRRLRQQKLEIFVVSTVVKVVTQR
ncbi:MAG: 4-(cytidine 5'-diphospho)-2-C-methyl-D-erythritol kinase [Chloroflexi bacterium RBG_13_50_10]|nr:MAG: 4-(cytidine 5'-diphospho)-2-C-methyl-D-erythritol kinase [Chloroflexi bacterium RBG_13_50_10]